MDDILPITSNTFSRHSESFAITEVRCVKHVHTWVVKGFSQCECRYLETIPALPHLDPSKHVFRVRLHPQGNKESNKDFCFFQVFSQTNLKYKAKFTVVNVRGDEIPATVYNGTQQLNGYFEYIRREQLIQHIAPQDEIKLMLSLSVVYDTVTRSTDPNTSPQDDCSLCALSKDMTEHFTRDIKFTDFSITCKDSNDITREIQCHRFLLYARSSVFKAMLQEHTGEFKNGKVNFTDIGYEVLNCFIQYLYTGKLSTKNPAMLQEMLKMGDRFQVEELKDQSESALKANLKSDNVCSLLSLSDVHSAFHLRKECLRYVSLNMNEVLKTDGWADFVARYPELATECMSNVVNNGEETTSEDPPPKKFRIEYRNHDSA